MIAQLDPLYIRTRPRKAVVRVLSHFLFQGRYLTTGHRWLNKLILAELGLVKHLPQLKSVKMPIFIVGTGRSGSTILGKVLSMHRDVGFLNEPKALWYTIVKEEDVNGHFNRGPARYHLDERQATLERIKQARRLFSFYSILTGSKRVLDKNPEITFRVPFVRAIFPDARFVFLVRNGWDTVHSIAAWSRRERTVVGGETQDWWGLNRRKWRLMVEELVPIEPLLFKARQEIKEVSRQEEMAAVEWIVTMQQGIRIKRSMEDCICQIRYEQLTQHPRRTLKAVMEFCELPEDDVFLSYSARVLSANRSTKPISLPPAIERAFLDTMRSLDYATDDGS